MTDLEKVVQRRTLYAHRRRRFIVMLMPGDVIGFREERRRKVFTATLAGVFDQVVKWNVEAERIKKQQARRANRKR